MTPSRYFTAPIPNGWFQLVYTEEVAVGQVLPVEYFGRKLIVFRTQSGEVSTLDAGCARCGAHLGIGGKVEGEHVLCPRHHTRFDTRGACVSDDGKGLSIRAFPTRVLTDRIMVWHHAGGLAPEWEMPEDVPEWGTKEGVRNEDWTEFERRQWKIKTRNQEMAENAVDSVHFHYVHGTQNMPESQAEVTGHILRVFSGTGMETPQGHVDGSVESLSYGFGLGLVRFKGIVETLLMSSVTPIDSDYVDVRFGFSVRKVGGRSLTRGVGLAFINEVSRQLGQDIPIWENKVQLERPLIVEGDGPLGLFRRWSKQFYTEERAAAAE
jgi:3-ketosteroid 9alpha-monooxygenase subunit A